MKDVSIEVIVRGVLIHEGDLLVCRNRKHGHLFLPGGHVEFKEPAAAALEREVQEELGITLKAGRFLGGCEASFTQPRKSSQGAKAHHEINLLFQLLPPDNRPLVPASITSQEDHIEFVWLSLIPSRSPLLDALLPNGILPIVDLAMCPSVPADATWVSVMR